MEAISLITQAKNDGSSIYKPNKFDFPNEEKNENSGKILSNIDNNKLLQQKSHNHFGSATGNHDGNLNSNSSPVSRFLSQLLCCFGFGGHLPDYSVGNGADEAELAVCSIPADDHPAQEDLTPQEPTLVQRPDTDENPSDTFADLGGLLPLPAPDLAGRICAVIDLDETLVHSSFQCPDEADFTIEVEVEGTRHQIFVLKRPFVDEFLASVGQLFECVLFTASMGKYADPVSDVLDPNGSIHHRLFREACVYHCDSFVKDLATLGRPVDRCFIIDNSPASYMFNVENAIHVNTWTGEPDDTELRDLILYLERLAKSESVSEFLRNNPSPTGVPVSMAQLAVAMPAQMKESND